MNTKIFRDASIARLSSPEQLDKMLRVTSARSWIALIALVLILVVAGIWGFEGRIATKANGEGVVIRSGNVMNVASLGSGRVLDITVQVGDQVRANQVIATVAQPDTLEKIRISEEQIADAERAHNKSVDVRESGLKLKEEALDKQRISYEKQITDLENERKLYAEQIPVDAELLAKGLITKNQTYQTQLKLASIDSQITNLQGQISQLNSTRYESQTQGVQSELDSTNHITDLKRNLEALKKQLDQNLKVVSPYSGQVLEIKVVPGALVSAATPIISIQPNIKELEAVLYIPSKKAKEIETGMDVELSPSVVKREEFGFIRAKVTYVADYPATEAALARLFENNPLSKELAQQEPVTEVRVRMIEDSSTPSGYMWSSAKGAPVKLTGGMLCTADVVTRQQKPVSLIFPTVKELLGLG
jgi:HlyD family secretion protein